MTGQARFLRGQRRYWLIRRFAWLLALIVPLPLVLLALAKEAPTLLLVDLPVGIAAGGWNVRFWSRRRSDRPPVAMTHSDRRRKQHDDQIASYW